MENHKLKADKNKYHKKMNLHAAKYARYVQKYGNNHYKTQYQRDKAAKAKRKYEEHSAANRKIVNLPAAKLPTPTTFKFKNIDESVLDEFTKDDLVNFMLRFARLEGRSIKGYSTAKRDELLRFAKAQLARMNRLNAKYDFEFIYSKLRQRKKAAKMRETVGAPPGPHTSNIDVVSLNTFPQQRAIIIEKQIYDARSLIEWLQKSAKSTVPHIPNREFNSSEKWEIVRRAGIYPGLIARVWTNLWHGFAKVIKQTKSGRWTVQPLRSIITKHKEGNWQWKEASPGLPFDKPISVMPYRLEAWDGVPIKIHEIEPENR